MRTVVVAAWAVLGMYGLLVGLGSLSQVLDRPIVASFAAPALVLGLSGVIVAVATARHAAWSRAASIGLATAFTIAAVAMIVVTGTAAGREPTIIIYAFVAALAVAAGIVTATGLGDSK